MPPPEETTVLIHNVEVLQLLEERVKNRTRPRKKYQHRDWVEQQVLQYLQSTPCVQLDPDRVTELQSKLQGKKQQRFAVDHSSNGNTTAMTTGYGLSDAEAIQVLNLLPTEPVDIHLLIDELHSRIPEKQQAELLETIATYRKPTTTSTSSQQEDGVNNNDNETHEPKQEEEDEVVEEDAMEEEATAAAALGETTSATAAVKQETGEN